MKLSCEKKWGYIHVRGGALVRVVHGHAFATNGQTQVKQTNRDEVKDAHLAGTASPKVELTTVQLGPTISVAPGDLAIEVREVKKGNLLGYAHITGAAAQLINYEVKRPERYEPAVMRHAPLYPPKQVLSGETLAEYGRWFEGTVMAMKLDRTVDLYVFSSLVPDEEAAQHMADTIYHVGRCIPKEMTDDEAKQLSSHLLVSIHSTAKKKGGRHWFMHHQAARDANEICANPFIAQLCFESLEHTTPLASIWKPWEPGREVGL